MRKTIDAALAALAVTLHATTPALAQPLPPERPHVLLLTALSANGNSSVNATYGSLAKCEAALAKHEARAKLHNEQGTDGPFGIYMVTVRGLFGTCSEQ